MILSPLHQQASSPPHSSTMCVMPPMVPDMPSPSYLTSPTTPSYGHCYAITQLFNINIPNHAFLWPLVSISTSPLKRHIYYTTRDARHTITQLFDINIPNHAFLWPLVSISTSPLKCRIYYTTCAARHAITQLFDINIPNHAFLWPLVSISTSPLKHRIYYTTRDARHAITQLFNISIPSLTWAHCSGTSASFTALQFSGNMQPSSSVQYGGYVPGAQPTPPSTQPAPPSARPASPYHLGEEPSSLPQNNLISP